MAEYHICYEVLGIYAGTFNKDKSIWRNRSDVTNETLKAVAQYCVENKRTIEFNYREKKYRLEVKESEE